MILKRPRKDKHIVTLNYKAFPRDINIYSLSFSLRIKKYRGSPIYIFNLMDPAIFLKVASCLKHKTKIVVGLT